MNNHDKTAALRSWLKLQLERLTEISEANHARGQSALNEIRDLGKRVDEWREKIAKM